ncbi:hypothetical protein C1645_855465 [Glomus cerebriforme]|uniref:Ion transport domain-containing protein n=1 Tax=Glomus cerebriforme TaxID=658196 RepID=A0A397TKU8_9GLOM|nr:hypothetical protein C1645_855465 [Glomus cerebriforme]
MSEKEKDEILIIEERVYDDSYTHITLSPDGKQFAIFNKDSYEIKICDVEQINELKTINPFKHSLLSIKEMDLYQDTLGWSIAISDKFKRIDDTYDNLIAVSCFGRDSISNTPTVHDVSLDLKGDRDVEKISKSIFGTTKIFSANDNFYSVPFAGVVKFMKNDANFICLVIINSIGMYKCGLELNETLSQWSIDKYKLPEALEDQLKQLQNGQQRVDMLSRSITNDYLFIEDFRNRNRIIEAYNLRTRKIERTFQENFAQSSFNDASVYAFSHNNHLFAFSHDKNKIKIHLMENGLEVSSKLLEGVRRIIFMEFVHNDEKLLIVTQEPSETKTFKQVVNVWDLFSTTSNSFRTYEDKNRIFPHKDVYQLRLSNASGIILSIGNDNEVVSILDHPDIKNLIEVEPLSIFSSLTQINLENIDSSKYHIIFGNNGEKLDIKDYDQEIINSNTEPWIIQNTYHRISAFLDDEKKIQLVIGQSTVQVWYTCHIDPNSKSKKSYLEFIWTSHRHTPIEIESLAVGNRAFSLKLSNPKITIDLPCHDGQVTIIKDACNSLVHLYNQRGKYMKLSRQRKYDRLLHQTHSIIRHFINHYPSVWRLMDIRYNLMESLIKARDIVLINKVLSFGKHDYYLHTPRKLHWSREKKTTDIEIAIEISIQDNSIGGLMVGFLLEYYSNNAKDNIEWMTTVTNVMPKLYEAKLDLYIKELLYQPCFGSIEIYKSGIKIPDRAQIRPSSHSIKGFSLPNKLKKLTEEKPTLNERLTSFIKGTISSIMNANIKTDKGICGSVTKMKQDDQRVILRVVPLPNFTVYPEGIDPKNDFKFSKLLKLIFLPRGYKFNKTNLEYFNPFLQLILSDGNDYLFDNPAMEAVIDFKWNQARTHFIRTSCGLYIIYALCFGFLSWAYVRHLETTGIWRDCIIVIITLFYFLAYHLLGIELQQLHHHGFQRYLSIYNLFDLMVSVIPSTVVSIIIGNSFEFENGFGNAILLLRLFSVAANYIYVFLNIMRSVLPFLVLMLIVMIGFAHAIFVILAHPNLINLNPIVNTYSYTDPNTNKSTTITADYDVTSPDDNPFSSFLKSIEAAYFWLSGDFPQINSWDLISIHIITIVASLLLVIVMQNMLISLMGNVFNDASDAARLGLLKWRAELIYEYEVIEKAYYQCTENDPTYIYYTGQSRIFEQWEEKSKQQRKGFKSLERIDELMNKDDHDDDDEFPDETNIERFWHCNCSYFEEGKKEEKNESKKEDNIIVKENEQITSLQNQVNTLNDKLTSMEINLNVLLELLKKQAEEK